MKNAWDQSRLLAKKVSIDEEIQKPQISNEKKQKLLLTKEAHRFAEIDLGLKSTKNYTQFVELNRPYVTYILHVAPKFDLESYKWWFPIVGSVPYKGYFSKEGAEEEEQKFDKNIYDTSIRGVTAYSTLGWFQDPLWSSMLNYEEHSLVNTIIHETVHATIFLKGQADFNEKLATFLGDWGTELFYQKKEGDSSPTLKKIRAENQDQKIFSQFLSESMSQLRTWYKTRTGPITETDRNKKFDEIKMLFQQKILPQLQTDSWSGFAKAKINNAYLLSLGAYFENQEDFQKLRSKLKNDFASVRNYFLQNKKSQKAEEELRQFISL
ncbi:MAG: aminopeptidase [Bdellovibrionales bacterium]|nr:aminopeptidase [Bdellovibrionales bacterium]